MKAPKELIIDIDGTLTEAPLEKVVIEHAKKLAAEIGVKSYGTDKVYAMGVFKDVWTEASVDFAAIEDAEDRKQQQTFYKGMKALVDTHKKNLVKVEQQRLQAEEAKKKQGQMIVKAAGEGAEAAEKLGLSIITGMQKMVGSDFVVSDHGLTAAQGVTITPDSMSHAVRGLLEGSDKLTKARTKFLVNLGDAVNIARKAWGEDEGDNIVAQATPVEGQGKHNVLQAASVMAYIDHLYPDQNDRPDTNIISFTHLQEAKNYGRNKKGEDVIKPAKVRSILKKAIDENLSCADMRELLKKERPAADPGPGTGDGSGDGSGKGEGGEGGVESASAPSGPQYLYDRYSDGVVLFSTELREDLLKEKNAEGPVYKTISLADMAVLKPSGKVHQKIEEAEATA